MLAAVGGLGSEALLQACSRLRAALDARLQAAVAAAAGEGGADAAALAAWAAGGASLQLSLHACQQRLEGLLEQAQAAARCNLAPLQQLGTPPR